MSMLALFRCPLCSEPFQREVFGERPGQRVEDGVLHDARGHLYPIIHGIPRLVPGILRDHPGWVARWGSRLEVAELKDLTGNWEGQEPGTVRSFGFEWQWDWQPRTEADLRFRVLEQCKLDPEFFRGKLVLDAGCGAGMQTRFMAELGASVVALDLSEAVLSAARNNLGNPMVQVVQGDLTRPPFTAETFDFVYSEGVLHHTKDPKESFRVLSRLVKPGGHIAAGFYTRRERGVTPYLLLRQPLRAVLSRLPGRLTWYLTAIAVPLNAIPLLNRVLRKTILLYDPRNPTPLATWSMNYDFYGLHTYQHYLRPSEIRTLFREPGLKLESLVEGKPGFYRARKAASVGQWAMARYDLNLQPVPRVSVVMAVHNGERHLRQALESLLAQRLADIEVIAVDDGSTDATPGILASVADPRLRVVRRTHAGQTPCLNVGLWLARAPYVARQDADDVSLPERLEQQAAYFDRHAEVALLGSGVTVIDEEGRHLRDYIYPSDHDALVARLMRFESPFPHTTFMFRTEVVRGLGGYDERFPKAQDFDLLFRIIVRYRIASLPVPLCQLRLSISSSTFADGRADQLRWALVAYARAGIRREKGEDILEHPEWPSMLAEFSASFAAGRYERVFRASRQRTAARLAFSSGRWGSGVAALGAALANDPGWLIRQAGLQSQARLAEEAWRWLSERLRSTDVRDSRLPRV